MVKNFLRFETATSCRQEILTFLARADNGLAVAGEPVPMISRFDPRDGAIAATGLCVKGIAALMIRA